MMNQYRANNGVNDNAVNGLPLTTSLKDIAGQGFCRSIYKPNAWNTEPSWNASHVDYDNGLMDDFMLTGNYFASPSTYDPNGTRTMGYYDWTDLPDYMPWPSNLPPATASSVLSWVPREPIAPILSPRHRWAT